VVLCLLTFAGAVGVAGWEAVVFKPDGSTSDSPLPLALGKVVGESNPMYHLLVTVGIFGLVASFHGLILAGGRSTFEFGRTGYAARWLGHVHPHFRTPAKALLANMAVGLVALATGRTAEIITVSVFGALTLYIVAMVCMIRLRRREPELERPFRTPFYPLSPVVALVIAAVSLFAMCVYNTTLALLYAGILLLSFVLFRFFTVKKKEV
jgi:ethanolamine permease